MLALRCRPKMDPSHLKEALGGTGRNRKGERNGDDDVDVVFSFHGHPHLLPRQGQQGEGGDHQRRRSTRKVVDRGSKNLRSTEILGRLAPTVAIHIRGKNLVNADKVAVSGKKRNQKLHRRHSGRPGCMTVETFDQLQQRIPERIIQHAARSILIFVILLAQYSNQMSHLRLVSLILLLQHFDRRGQLDIALTKINEALRHTPVVIDSYFAKGRMLK